MIASVKCTGFTYRLGCLVERGRQEAVRRGHPTLVSSSVGIPPMQPVVLFNRTYRPERVLWEQPSRGFALAACGVAEQLTGDGAERFSQVSAAWRCLLSWTLVDTEPGCPFSAPIGLGGFAFDSSRQPDCDWQGYPNAQLQVPRFLVLSYADPSSSSGSHWLNVNVKVTPEADREAIVDGVVDELDTLLGPEEETGVDPEYVAPAISAFDSASASDWQERVAAVVQDIQDKRIEKLVLARQIRIRLSPTIDPAIVVRRLRVGYGQCTIFAFAQDDQCFVGATPERLVRLDGRRVQSDCLAGSIGRGEAEGEDRCLADNLLADGKERHEHALVVRALQAALTPLCMHLTVPDQPALLRMPNVQHLHTPIEGVVRKKGDLLGLVERLHPSPACGGLPRQAALSLIRVYEPFDRGWYAGPIGWIDGRGSGEFVVALRSALLTGRQATQALLYAGCGIVAGSSPEREYAESCLKLRPMLWALQGV